jgi:pimeloyl-ACP methyl ester carboxylesterase
MKLIEPLTNPTAFGGKAEDAFDVVIPSMAGYGFSERPKTPGWDCIRMARAWDVLMKRLGYSEYVAQGGDWGALVSEEMGVQAPAGLLGIHINLPFGVPHEILAALGSHTPPAGLAADEKRAFERIDYFLVNGLSYAQQMANHPQTLYGIADSPIGLAAWFLDHDLLSYQMITRTFEGKSEGLTRDDVLDNITLAWLTNTGISGARLYRESKVPFFAPLGVKIPVAVSAFPDELYQLPRSWAERAYPNLIHYNKLPKGGHFAAWEQPELLVDELRASFKTLR